MLPVKEEALENMSLIDINKQKYNEMMKLELIIVHIFRSAAYKNNNHIKFEKIVV